MTTIRGKIIVLLVYLIVLPGCADDPEGPPIDSVAPTIVTTFPANNAAISAPTTIRASASDNVGVSRVSFVIDGAVVREDSVSPYEYEWFVYYYADGNPHTILTTASDAAGNVGQAGLILVTVLGEAAGLLGLLGPDVDAEYRETNMVAFRWHRLPSAESYRLEVAGDSLFAAPEYAAEVADTSTALLLQAQGTHYWRVRATDSAGTLGPWSATRRFLVDGPVAPTLWAPADRAMIPASPGPSFSWSGTAGATLYEFQLSPESAFSGLLISATPADTETVVPTIGAGVYYWRVRAKNAISLWGEWSQVRVLGAGVFTRTYGGPANDWGAAASPAPEGGYVVAGETFSGGSGMGDAYIVKTDSLGIAQWEHTYGSPGEDGLRSIIPVSGGGYIACGFTRPGTDNADIYVIRTDGGGNLLWSKTFGGASYDYGLDIVQTADLGFALTGTTFSTDSGTSDIFLLKLTAAGDSVWMRTFGGGGNETGKALELTGDGGFVIAGNTGSFGAGNGDIYLVRTDADGAELWSRTYGTAGFEDAYGVLEAGDGGFLVSGTNYSIFFLKTDSDGTELWNRTYGDGQGIAIAPTSTGGYVLAANYTGGTGSISDIRLVRMDANGNTEWDRLIGGADAESPSFVLPAGDGGFITGGYSYSFGAGEADVVLVKTTAEGTTLLPE